MDLLLEKIIPETTGKDDKTPFFNNAVQTWNHIFYWRSLRPKGSDEPSEMLKQKDREFLRHPGCMQEGVGDCRNVPVWQWLCMARAGWR